MLWQQRDINPSKSDCEAAIEAGRQASIRIREYLLRGTSFAVETTLSGRSIMTLMADARSRGYEIHLLFVALNNPEKSITGIRTRAKRGGHLIPDVDVEATLHMRSLVNLVEEAIRPADIARIYDKLGMCLTQVGTPSRANLMRRPRAIQARCATQTSRTGASGADRGVRPT